MARGAVLGAGARRRLCLCRGGEKRRAIEVNALLRVRNYFQIKLCARKI